MPQEVTGAVAPPRLAIAYYAPDGPPGGPGGPPFMLYPFFALAAQSPTRQGAFRRVVVAHLLLLLGAAFALSGGKPGAPATLLGHVLLIGGIVEGALLVGWRLTQLPRSQ